MTVLEVIQRSTEFLGKKGVESPRLQVELLLAHVLGVPRLNLYLNFERQLSEPELEAARELVRRRAGHEPLQHILGSACFCGLEIKVDRRVLVPRPETELLAQRAWEYLRGLKSPRPAALDFGTGSGCIAIVLAEKCPTAQVHAVDISPDAIVVARENASRHGVTGRIQFLAGDGFTPVPPGSTFDVIVANPPYIPSAEIDDLAPEVRKFDPHLALDGGADGLDFYRQLAAQAARYLEPGGKLMVEFGDGQAERIGEVLNRHKWVVENVTSDYSGRPRILTARPERVWTVGGGG